ncbi:unnamed protein product [Zymoseptoria tritici ST99CH_1A5]|uniref:EGF-like domain-containing protein n=1 Tax=Zymoseptoria tritici ST99CH_1A5 TaxID=1276529 RepID=A0A1Y6LGN7_ZYMTR|nr:unnamed protein product [Zymoseptoria tritici ST99CH_1A5]
MKLSIQLVYLAATFFAGQALAAPAAEAEAEAVAVMHWGQSCTSACSNDLSKGQYCTCRGYHCNGSQCVPK